MKTLTALLGLAVCLLAQFGAHADAEETLHHRAQLQGRGPTVVLESGWGDTLEAWSAIQSNLASGCARVFSYNRAGYIGSDVPQASRSAAAVVTELRDELRRYHLAPPYVLVGHSLGGLYMQYFARNFPRETRGLLLIDPSHWEQGLHVDPSADAPYQSRTATTLFMPWIMRRELNDSADAGRQVQSSPSAASFPTVVLSSTLAAAGESEENRQHERDLQKQIAAAFPGARHTFVENAGHYVQRDRPDIVIAAIRELAGCTARP